VTVNQSAVHHQSIANAIQTVDNGETMKQALPDREDLLTRDETAVALTAAGCPIRSATLGTMATRGGGPPFRRFGTRSLYRWGDVIDWAESRMAQSRRPNEADASAAAVA
jgi:hypothetical protein